MDFGWIVVPCCVDSGAACLGEAQAVVYLRALVQVKACVLCGVGAAVADGRCGCVRRVPCRAPVFASALNEPSLHPETSLQHPRVGWLAVVS